MTRLPILAAALASMAGVAHATPPSLELVRSLAERPMGFVVGDTCHVRGAVWAGGPRADVNVALLDVASDQSFSARTDAHGIWVAQLPYSKPAVYQERLVDAMAAPKAVLERVRIHEGGVVCDHRLTFQLSSTTAQEAN